MSNVNLNFLKLPKSERRKKIPIKSGQKDRKCQFCTNGTGLYTCPGCQSSYCSVGCFRSTKHLECSEQFYKKLVLEHLKHLKINDDEKRKFLDILKKNNKDFNENDDYLDVISSLEHDDDDQIEDINLDFIQNNEKIKKFLMKILPIVQEQDTIDESIWNELSDSDQLEFIDIVKGNARLFDNLIQSWQPWWLRSEWQTCVEEAGDDQDHDKIQQYPYIYTQIQPISKLTTKTPFDLSVNIMEVCFAYCHLARYYNGEITCSNPNSTQYDNQPPDCCRIWKTAILDKLFYYVPYLNCISTKSSVSAIESIEKLSAQYLTCKNDDNCNNEDFMADLTERKINLKLLLTDLRIIMDKENISAKKMIIKINDESNVRCASKGIILAISDLINILIHIKKCIRHGKKRTNGELNLKSIKLALEKLKFYLSYCIEYLDEHSLLLAVDFHLNKLDTEAENSSEMHQKELE